MEMELWMWLVSNEKMNGNVDGGVCLKFKK